jgi:SAM-dependent methyltransferase
MLFLSAAGFVVLSTDTDQPLSLAETRNLRNYYATAYSEGESGLSSEQDEIYVKIARDAATAYRVKENLESFVLAHGLTGKKALDVGAGRGYLQDVVEDYTGLDISPSARRFFRKRFVLGTATSMPFEEDSYDLIWSVWVLEHVPNPEQALLEMRRTVKDGGLLYLMPAWNCGSWLAEGYQVRPYSDLTARQKLLKTIHAPRMIVRHLAIIFSAPMTWARWKWKGGPTQFHYTRLEPNYTTYWQPDSDAVNSLDRYEMLIWFLSRGDECLNCDQGGIHTPSEDPRLIIRVHKGTQHRAELARKQVTISSGSDQGLYRQPSTTLPSQ